MSESLFTGRLGLLRQNLERIADSRVTDEERFATISQPRYSHAKLSAQVKAVAESYRALRECYRNQVDLHDALEQLGNAVFPLENTTELGPRSQALRHPEHRGALGDVLSRAATLLLRRVDALEDEDLSLEARWTELTDLEDRATAVFGEYVEFIRGSALRGLGMDQQLCVIADRLIVEVANQWASFTVPARREMQGASFGSIVRIGFPGWTLSSLPIAVHEYGHVFVDTLLQDREAGVDVGSLSGDGAVDDHQLRTLLADAFAALTAGPCYAWALFTSRLGFDPMSRLRAATVLEALSRGAAGSYAVADIERISDGWTAAADELAQGDEIELDDGTLTEIVRTIEMSVLSPFAYGDWQATIVPLSSALRSDDDGPIATDATLTVVDVVNAAWLARTSDGTDPVHIEGRALAVALRLCGGATGGHLDSPLGSQRRSQGPSEAKP